MADLRLTYMGLELSNPLIVASSSLTNTAARVRDCESHGAGAVVLKSLFEEQIKAQTDSLEEASWPYPHPEAYDYVRQMGMRLGQEEYLKLIEESKKAVSIPVIASLNCVSTRWWLDYARQIENSGADALELNIAITPGLRFSAEELERLYLHIVEAVREKVKLPLAVKIGPFFSALPQMVQSLRRAGAAALVLFNRFYQLDLDTEKLSLRPGYRFSSPEEIYLPLRWIAILAGQARCDLAASTGVHDSEALIKMLLAGASAVQVCSTLKLKGLGQIRKLLRGLEAWMESHGFKTVKEFKGKMSQGASGEPELYERLQYIKSLVGIE